MAEQGKAGTQSGRKLTADERKYLKVKAKLDDAIKIGKKLIIMQEGNYKVVKKDPRTLSDQDRQRLEKEVHQAAHRAGETGGRAQNKRGGGKVKKYAHGGKVRSYNFIN